MAGSAAETLIGAVVLVAAGGFLVYAANTADISVGGQGYEVSAKFRRAEGLSAGGDVRIAGVKVGSIRSMELDPKSYQAVVSMVLDATVQIPDDTAAKITASGLLGDNFIALTPGSSEYMLEAGEEITYTQGSVNLLDIATKAIAGNGTDSGASD